MTDAEIDARALDRNAVRQLANVARNLLARLREVDAEMPGSMAAALDRKIEHFARYGGEDA